MSVLENPPFHTYPLLPSYTRCLLACEHLHVDGLREREVGISTAGGPTSEDVRAAFPKKAGFAPKKPTVPCQESRFPKHQGPTENKDRHRPQARLNTCCARFLPAEQQPQVEHHQAPHLAVPEARPFLLLPLCLSLLAARGDGLSTLIAAALLLLGVLRLLARLRPRVVFH